MSLRPPPSLEKLHAGLMTTVDCHVRSSGLPSEDFVIQHMKNLLEVYPNVRQLVANGALLNVVPDGIADPNLIPVQVVQGAGFDNIDELRQRMIDEPIGAAQPPALVDNPLRNAIMQHLVRPLQNLLVEEEERIADEPMESEETAVRQGADLKRPEPTNIVPEPPSSSFVNRVGAGFSPPATPAITTPRDVPLVPEDVALRPEDVASQQQPIRGGGKVRGNANRGGRGDASNSERGRVHKDLTHVDEDQQNLSNQTGTSSSSAPIEQNVLKRGNESVTDIDGNQALIVLSKLVPIENKTAFRDLFGKENYPKKKETYQPVTVTDGEPPNKVNEALMSAFRGIESRRGGKGGRGGGVDGRSDRRVAAAELQNKVRPVSSPEEVAPQDVLLQPPIRGGKGGRGKGNRGGMTRASVGALNPGAGRQPEGVLQIAEEDQNSSDQPGTFSSSAPIIPVLHTPPRQVLDEDEVEEVTDGEPPNKVNEALMSAFRGIESRRGGKGGRGGGVDGRSDRRVAAAELQTKVRLVFSPEEVAPQDVLLQPPIRGGKTGRGKGNRGGMTRASAGALNPGAGRQPEADVLQIAEEDQNSSDQPGTSSSSAPIVPVLPTPPRQVLDEDEVEEEEEEVMDSDTNLQNAPPAIDSSVVCCGDNSLRYSIEDMECHADENCKIEKGAEFAFYNMGKNRLHCCKSCIPKVQKQHKIRFSAFCLATNTNFLEEMYQCRLCNERRHTQCDFYFEKEEDYICSSCVPRNIRLNVDGIPKNKIDEFITKYINEVMNNTCQAKNVGALTCLNVHSREREAKLEDLVPKSQLRMFKNKKFEASVTYTERVFHVYQRQKGIDVLVFIISSQEIINENTKSLAMLDYVDSAMLLVCPPQARTKIYHAIINSYSKFLKDRGFHEVHIWAKPNKLGTYFFRMYPVNQKRITLEKLIDWYHNMMSSGVREKCYDAYRSFKTERERKRITNATQLPLFNGGLWSVLMDWAVWMVKDSLRKGVKTTFNKELKKYFDQYENNYFIIQLNPESIPEEKINMSDIKMHEFRKLGVRETFVDTCANNNWEFVTQRSAMHASVGIMQLIDARYKRLDEMEEQEPALEEQEPELEQEEPAHEEQEPELEQEEPAHEEQEPEFEQEEPAHEEQEPEFEQEEPALDQQEPELEQQEPST